MWDCSEEEEDEGLSKLHVSLSPRGTEELLLQMFDSNFVSRFFIWVMRMEFSSMGSDCGTKLVAVDDVVSNLDDTDGSCTVGKESREDEGDDSISILRGRNNGDPGGDRWPWGSTDVESDADDKDAVSSGSALLETLFRLPDSKPNEREICPFSCGRCPG